jgi:hypothetical protein
MQLAVNAQLPRDLGGLGAKVLYVGELISCFGQLPSTPSAGSVVLPAAVHGFEETSQLFARIMLPVPRPETQRQSEHMPEPDAVCPRQH